MASSPTVALFRAVEDAQPSAAALAARGVACVLAPVVETRAVEAAPPRDPFDYVLATSAKAFVFGPERVLDAARAAPLHCVGAKTAAEGEARGFRLAAAPSADVASLLPALPPGRALYLAGADRKPALEAALGARVATLVVYEARARDGFDAATAAAVAGAGAALHYSERGAELAARFAEAAGVGAAFRSLPHVCLSRAVAHRLAGFGVARALWPGRPVEADLFETLETALSE